MAPIPRSSSTAIFATSLSVPFPQSLSLSLALPLTLCGVAATGQKAVIVSRQLCDKLPPCNMPHISFIPPTSLLPCYLCVQLTVTSSTKRQRF